MQSDPSCTFCEIVSGKGTSHKVYEDQHSLAFMDIYPASDGHILVISKTHCESVFEINSDVIKAVADTSRRVAIAIHKTLSPDGISIVQANGAAAGQNRHALSLAFVAAHGGTQNATAWATSGGP